MKKNDNESKMFGEQLGEIQAALLKVSDDYNVATTLIVVSPRNPKGLCIFGGSTFLIDNGHIEILTNIIEEACPHTKWTPENVRHEPPQGARE